MDGCTVEVSADVEVRRHGRLPEGESVPLRLSHVVVKSTDARRTRGSYERHLGLRLSDTLRSPQLGEPTYFLRCTPLHQRVAVASGPHVWVHHVSFELRGLEQFLRGSGRVLRGGTTKIRRPGRHLAGDDTFAYLPDPFGNTMECTTRPQTLDEDRWHPSVEQGQDPVTQDQWGIADPMSEIIARQSVNDVDHGVFVAPPV